MVKELIDNNFGTMSYELYKGQPYLHVYIHTWNKTNRRECYEILEDIKVMFNEDGYNKLYVGIGHKNNKLHKFLTMFKFKIEDTRNNYPLYSQEI